MCRRIGVVITIALIAGVAALWIGCHDGEVDENQFHHAVSPPQAAERTFADVDVERLTWDRDPHPHLLHPEQLRITDDRVYVTDIGENTIKAFDWTGRLVSAIGAGRGEGPGEVQRVPDFHVRGDTLWALDMDGRHVSVFDTDGAYHHRFSIDTDGAPFRLAPMGDRWVVQQLAPGTELFLRVDPTGRVIDRFGDLMAEHDLHNPLAFDGQLVSIADGILWGARNASYLYYFDEAGDRRRVTQMVDAIEFEGPDPRETNGARMEAPDSPMEYYVRSVQNDTLVVHALDQEQTRSLLDYYTAEGEYLESIELPDPLPHAQLHGDYVFGVRDTTLYKYRIRR